MSIDWGVAGDWAEKAHAVAMIEGGGDPDAKGDFIDEKDPLTNKARGLFQWHPAAFQEAYGCHPAMYRPSPADSWVEADLKAFAARMETWVNGLHMSFERALMCFHLGFKAVTIDGNWAQGYLDRFDAALNKLRAVKK